MAIETDPGAGKAAAHGRSEVERLLCGPEATGALEAVLPHHADAWTMQLPGLDSFAGFRRGRKRPRICIATEQVTGPVRNGGIGTTYAALAMLLADAGFDVTVLYLRGTYSEIETIEHWIAYYAARGVKLVPAPDYARAENFRTNADRWLRIPYNMMRWLQDEPMDVVHVSEWRGTGYLSLLAKRQGLCFADTLFVVKTSSPWMWNRMYGSQMLERADDLVKTYAERRSVELADLVIGGSLHLLRWMTSQGYALPPERAFVQPNVVTFDTLERLMAGRKAPRGKRVAIDEFVFFGRLEARKGLFIFCQAIRRLIRKGVALPSTITFMGKPGGRLTSHPDIDTPDFIREVSADWPCEVKILSNFQQYEAIEYLLGEARLAVMPSIIENSSMAIYEAAICAIPTVASDVGGNSELIAAEDHAAVLCKPHPVDLGDRLEEVLAHGAIAPRPSFDNRANLERWRTFHRQLGGKLRTDLLAATRPPAVDVRAVTVSVCVYFCGDLAAISATLASLAAQAHPPAEVIVGVDSETAADCAAVADLLAGHGFAPAVIEAFDLDAGMAFNRMAARARGDRLLFLWEGATLLSEGLGELARIAAMVDAPVLNYLCRMQDPQAQAGAKPGLFGQMIVGVSDGFLRNETRETPLFVAREFFLQLNGFTSDYRVLAYDQEFIVKAQLAGARCETVMRELGAVVLRTAEWIRQRGYDQSASGFRVMRPTLAAAPMAMRDTLLLLRGFHARISGQEKAGLERGREALAPESMLIRVLADVGRRERSGRTEAVDEVTTPAVPRRPRNRKQAANG